MIFRCTIILHEKEFQAKNDDFLILPAVINGKGTVCDFYIEAHLMIVSTIIPQKLMFQYCA